MLKELERINAPIEEYTIDIKDIVDRLYLGPQGDLLESIEKFNDTYNTSISINRQYNLKPGSWKQIKDAYTKNVLRWDMKPRGLDSLMARIGQYRWKELYFKNALEDISRNIYSLKRDGVEWIDNTEDVEEAYNNLKTTLLQERDEAIKMYPNVSISLHIVPTGRIVNNNAIMRNIAGLNGDNSVTSDYMLFIRMYIEKPTMTIHKLSDGLLDTREIETDDILVYAGVSILKMLSRRWNDRASTTLINSRYGLTAFYLSPLAMNEHTYISMSTDKYSFELDPRASFAGDNICRGNMDRELGSSLSNGQFLAFVTHTMNWLNNYYIPQTYPLHHPANLRIVGRNEQLEELNREGFINTNPLGRAKSCALPGIINNRIFRHSHPRTSNHGYSMYRYEEYLNPGIRAEDYIKAIKYSDLPCHECTFVSNCVYHPILALLYDNTELSVEDEAYLGLMYEYWFISKYMPEGDEYLQYVESTNIPYHTKEEIVEHSHRLTWIARAYRVLSDRDYLEDHYEELQENLIHTAVHELIQLLKSDLIDPNKVYKFAVALVEEHGIECYPQFINYVTSEDGFEDLTFNDKEHQSSLSERMEAVLGTTDILGNIPDTEPPTANIAFEQEFPTNDDDEEISDAERAIRWATSMGGGAQNL